MVQEEKTEQEPQQETPINEVRYFIDPDKARRLGRSLEHLVMARMCYLCRTRAEEFPEPPSLEDLLRDVAEHCAQEEGFIHSELPLQEIVFRTLLKNGNQPTTLAELHYAVTEEWATPMRPMNIGIRALKRILDRDTYYCFNEYSEA